MRKYSPASLLLYKITLCTLKFNINEWGFLFFSDGLASGPSTEAEVKSRRGAESIIPSSHLCNTGAQKGLIPVTAFPWLLQKQTSNTQDE